MSTLAVGERRSLWLPIIAALFSVVAGVAVAVDPTVAAAAAATAVAIYLAFVLPERILLMAFLLITLSGFRPFPPILGFHVQAQYFLLLPMGLRPWLSGQAQSAWAQDRWRRFLEMAALVIAASVVALAQDVLAGGSEVTVFVGDYVAWIMAFVLLFTLTGMMARKGPDFARTLYRIAVDSVGIFAVYTLLTSTGQEAVTQSSRLSLADLGPNETGLITAAGILLVIGPQVIRRVTLRELVWLPFLCVLLIRTGSRESIAAVIFGLLVLLLNARSEKAIAWYLYLLIGLGVAVAIFAAFASALVPHTLQRTVHFPELAPYLTVLGVHLPPPLAERVYIQVTGFQQFLQHPFIGLGFKQPLTIPEGANGPTWWSRPIILPVAHDSFITVAAQQGLIGFIPFVGLVVSGLRLARNSVFSTEALPESRDIAVGVRCALFVLVFGAFNIDAFYEEFKLLALFFWLVVTVALLQPASTPSRQAAPVPHLHRFPSSAPGTEVTGG